MMWRSFLIQMGIPARLLKLPIPPRRTSAAFEVGAPGRWTVEKPRRLPEPADFRVYRFWEKHLLPKKGALADPSTPEERVSSVPEGEFIVETNPNYSGGVKIIEGFYDNDERGEALRSMAKNGYYFGMEDLRCEESMEKGYTLNTPLEQFEVVLSAHPAAPWGWLTNAAAVVVAFGLLHLLLGALLFGAPRLVGGGWLQSAAEAAVRSLGDFVVANGGRAQQGLLPLLLPLALLLTTYNLGGLLPYGYTLSAHLLCTLYYGFGLFFGLNWVALARYGARFLAVFLPSGIGLGLAPLLVPIELVSYLFKPISLSVRLFANMLAGHALLKILLSFAFGALGGGVLAALLAALGLLLVGAILLLEFMVALLQVFVYLTLTTLYVGEVHRVEH